jgi:hypothetical protein
MGIELVQTSRSLYGALSCGGFVFLMCCAKARQSGKDLEARGVLASPGVIRWWGRLP